MGYTGLAVANHGLKLYPDGRREIMDRTTRTTNASKCKVKKETEHFESPEKIQVCQVNEFSATSKSVRSKGENQPQKVSTYNNPYGKKWHKTCQ